MKIRGAAFFAAGALVLAGCGGGDETASGGNGGGKIEWSKSSLAQQFRQVSGLDAEVKCDAGLPAEEGAKTECSVTYEGETTKTTAIVRAAGETGAVGPVFLDDEGVDIATYYEDDYLSDEDYPSGDEEGEPVDDEGDSDDSGMYAYGETVSGEEQDVQISAPKRVQVSSDDAMMCEGDAPKAYLQVTVTSKNTSKKPIDIGSTLYLTGTSGDKPACDVDAGGDDQSATILPGKTGRATIRFGVQDASAPLTIEVSEAASMDGSMYFTNDPSVN